MSQSTRPPVPSQPEPRATPPPSQSDSHLCSAWARGKCYLSSLRAGSFTTSLVPVLMGAVLAGKSTGHFSPLILLASLLTVISVHAAGNLVNTYCDFMRGVDSKRGSDDRTLVDSILTPEEVANLGE